MSSSNDSNQLLRFMNEATFNIQEALSRQSNGKKVNHRKFIQKRLQRGGKTNKKAKQVTATSRPHAAPGHQTTNATNRQPVAVLPPPTSYWSTLPPTDVQQVYQSVPTCSNYAYSPYSNSRSQSLDYDPEIESLLCEFGLDSPSQYSDTAADASRSGSVATTTWDSYLPTTSPPSDFSDIDDSAYSSPRNPSPVCYSNHQSPPFFHQQVATGSCEWHQSVPPVVSCPSSSLPPNYLSFNAAITPSLNEILELVTP